MSISYALGSLLDRLPYRWAEGQSPVETPAPTPAAKQEAPAVDASGSPAASHFSVLLSQVAAGGSDPASATEAAAPALKPNLDALNRVLSHYAAQSAEMDSIVSRVR